MKALAKFLCAAVAILAVANWAVAQQDNVQLRYKLKKGDPLVYQQDSLMKQTQTVKDMKIETEIGQSAVAAWTVKEVDAKGNLHVQTENKSLAAKIKIGPLGEFAYDSKDKTKTKNTLPGADIAPLYERLTGAKLTVVISPLGKIAEFKGYKELIGDLLKENKDIEKFGGASEEAAKINMSEFFPTFPEKAVSAGEKWEVPYEVQLPKIGLVKGKKIYWYQGEGMVGTCKTAKISVTTELSVDLNLDVDNAKVTGKMSVSGSKGTIDFDPQEGCVVAISNEITLSGNLTVTAGGMDIPVATEQVQTIKMNLLKGAPK